MADLKARFDHNIRVKAFIGIPFTMEDVAESLGVPGNELRSSWLVPHVNEGTLRKVGMRSSRDRKHQMSVWSGTYYLDLAEAESGRASGAGRGGDSDSGGEEAVDVDDRRAASVGGVEVPVEAAA